MPTILAIMFTHNPNSAMIGSDGTRNAEFGIRNDGDAASERVDLGFELGNFGYRPGGLLPPDQIFFKRDQVPGVMMVSSGSPMLFRLMI